MNELERKEIREAIEAADEALYHLENANGYLRSAGNWGLLDIFGGGLISGLVKHNKMGNAEAEIDAAKRALQRFSKELRDVSGYCSIHIGDFLTFADFFFDGLVADAMENCRCAIHMAASAIPGVFVAFNRKVMLGCRASKVRSLSFDAFESINYPYIAKISSLGMRIDKASVPERTGIFKLSDTYSNEVCMIKMFHGIHRSMIEAIAEKGYKGLYIEAYGIGGMPFIKHDFIGTLEKVIKGLLFHKYGRGNDTPGCFGLGDALKEEDIHNGPPGRG